jgi:hypothetical protein
MRSPVDHNGELVKSVHEINHYEIYSGQSQDEGKRI